VFIVLEQREMSTQLNDRRQLAAFLIDPAKASAVASSTANMLAAYTKSLGGRPD